jgi:hypothetical protein
MGSVSRAQRSDGDSNAKTAKVLEAAQLRVDQ